MLLDVFLLSVFVEAITELLLSPASIIHEQFIEPELQFHNQDGLLVKLFTCDFCLSFWIALAVGVFAFPWSFKGGILVFVIWRLSHYWRAVHKYLCKKYFLLDAGVVE